MNTAPKGKWRGRSTGRSEDNLGAGVAEGLRRPRKGPGALGLRTGFQAANGGFPLLPGRSRGSPGPARGRRFRFTRYSNALYGGDPDDRAAPMPVAICGRGRRGDDATGRRHRLRLLDAATAAGAYVKKGGGRRRLRGRCRLWMCGMRCCRTNQRAAGYGPAGAMIGGTRRAETPDIEGL